MIFLKGNSVLDFAITSLARRKLKNLTIFFVFVLIIFFVSTVILVTDSLKVESIKAIANLPDIIVQGTKAGRQELVPLIWKEKIQEILGVKQVTDRVWGYYYDAVSRANFTIMGIKEDDLIEDMSFTLEKGAMIKDIKDILVGKGIREHMHIDLGSEVFLYRPDRTTMHFNVKGTFHASTDLWSRDIFVMKEEALRDLFMLEDNLTVDFWVYVYNKDEAMNIAAKVNAFTPGARAITKSELSRTYEAVFGWRSGIILILFFTSILAFLILAWDKGTSLSAEEKREIGILKAIGWQTTDVLKLKFYEGAIISLLAFFTGFILAFINVSFFGASIFRPIMTGWSVIYPEFKLFPRVDLLRVFVIFFVSVLPYIASTIIPSWRASVIDPDIVIRGV